MYSLVDENIQPQPKIEENDDILLNALKTLADTYERVSKKTEDLENTIKIKRKK